VRAFKSHTPIFILEKQCAGTQSQLGTYCSTFRAVHSSDRSWVAPLVVAPTPSGLVSEPSEYKFATRAPVVRRSPSAKNPRTKTTNQGQLSAPSPTNGKPSTPSRTYQHQAKATPTPEQLDMRYYDSNNRYDEFLASFQYRIDGMTGQRGGWGF